MKSQAGNLPESGMKHNRIIAADEGDLAAKWETMSTSVIRELKKSFDVKRQRFTDISMELESKLQKFRRERRDQGRVAKQRTKDDERQHSIDAILQHSSASVRERRIQYAKVLDGLLHNEDVLGAKMPL